MMVDLSQLRWEHSMRNVPMNTIGAEMRLKGTDSWVSLIPFSIGGSSYNELSPCWTDMHDFQAVFKEKGVDRPSGLG